MPAPQTSRLASGHPPGRDRKALGAWSTPADLVELVVARTIEAAWLERIDRPIRVLDPACGDGRFLVAVARRIVELGGRAELIAVDVDPTAVTATSTALADVGAHTNSGADVGIEVRCTDALHEQWRHEDFDVVVGNPPFLSQLAARSTRGGSSRHGGGPYADAATEFLALAVRLTRPGGRIGLVLPQSVLAARDAGAVRAEVDRLTETIWSWWSPEHLFDAEVHVCALGFQRRPHEHSRLRTCSSSRTSAADIASAEIARAEIAGAEIAGAEIAGGGDPDAPPTTDEGRDQVAAHPVWTRVVAEHLGVPALPALHARGVLGDRAGLNANFRDEYYGMVPAVGDHVDGPPLVTTGLIDPGHCHWGERPVRFAKRAFDAPRVDLDRLDARMRRWADRKLVPKVLVATQTSVIEAVVDPDGAWLPGVPVTSVVPRDTADGDVDDRDRVIWEVGAVLTSPVATAWAWHRAAGTGLSARTLRLGPAVLADLPWPGGDLTAAVAALRSGDVERCGSLVTVAYGVGDDADRAALETWWLDAVQRLTRPRPLPTRRDGARGAPRSGEPDRDPASR